MVALWQNEVPSAKFFEHVQERDCVLVAEYNRKCLKHVFVPLMFRIRRLWDTPVSGRTFSRCASGGNLEQGSMLVNAMFVNENNQLPHGTVSESVLCAAAVVNVTQFLFLTASMLPMQNVQNEPNGLPESFTVLSGSFKDCKTDEPTVDQTTRSSEWDIVFPILLPHLTGSLVSRSSEIIAVRPGSRSNVECASQSHLQCKWAKSLAIKMWSIVRVTWSVWGGSEIRDLLNGWVGAPQVFTFWCSSHIGTSWATPHWWPACCKCAIHSTQTFSLRT